MIKQIAESIDPNAKPVDAEIVPAEPVQLGLLNEKEKAQLAFYEMTVYDALNKMLEACKALERIKTLQLYRDTHNSFDQYCLDRFGYSIARANQKIAAVKAFDAIENAQLQLPANERQVRDIAKLDDDQIVQVWSKALEVSKEQDRKIDYNLVREVKASLLQSQTPAPPKYFQTSLTDADHKPQNGHDKQPAHEKFISNKSDEWTTPEHLYKPFLKFLGLDKFDLDPCSNSHTNPSIPAINHFTIDDDGLEHPWHGNLFINPPFSQIEKFVDKLILEYQAGNVIHVMLVSKLDSRTGWFKKIYSAMSAGLMIHGHTKYGNSSSGAMFPSHLAYFGDRPNYWLSTYKPLGYLPIAPCNLESLEFPIYTRGSVNGNLSLAAKLLDGAVKVPMRAAKLNYLLKQEYPDKRLHELTTEELHQINVRLYGEA